METFSALLAICAANSPVPGEFPAQRPVTRSFDVFFYLRLNKRLSKQSWGWWFETLSCPLWRHRNVCDHSQPAWRGWISARLKYMLKQKNASSLWPNDVMASDMLVSIGSRNGLSSFRRQDINRTYADFTDSWILRNKVKWNFNQNVNIIFQKYVFWCRLSNVISPASWLFAPQFVQT